MSEYDFICGFLTNNNNVIYQIELTEDTIPSIYLILNGHEDKFVDFLNDQILCRYIGIYYHKVKKNIILAKKYYLLSANKGSVAALNSYGFLIQNENKALAISYYKMAIEKGNDQAIYNYAFLLETEHNIEQAILHYHMYYEKTQNTQVLDIVKRLVDQNLKLVVEKIKEAVEIKKIK
jgi:TPR repeat protein